MDPEKKEENHMKDTGPERYTIKHLDAVATKLRSMPPVDEENRQYTTEEMVKILSKDIIALQERGYTLDQVSKLLHAEGLKQIVKNLSKPEQIYLIVAIS